MAQVLAAKVPVAQVQLALAAWVRVVQVLAAELQVVQVLAAKVRAAQAQLALAAWVRVVQVLVASVPAAHTQLALAA